MRLRSSTIGTFLRCPRKYAIQYEDGYESKYPSPILEFGTGFHAGIETLAAGKSVAVARQSFNREASKMREYERYLGEMLIVGYSSVYRDDGLAYEAIEEPWEFTAGGLTASGKFDGLVRDPQGDLWVMEHKTTRRDIEAGADYWQALGLNIQLDLYLLACAKLEIPVRGVIYDVIRVPKLRRLKATPKDKQEFYKRDGKYGKKGDPKPNTRLHPETKQEFQARVESYFVDNWPTLYRREKFLVEERDLDKALKDLQDVGTLINTGSRPRNPQSCFAYNTECAFLPVCQGEAGLDNTELYQINTDPLGY